MQLALNAEKPTQKHPIKIQDTPLQARGFRTYEELAQQFPEKLHPVDIATMSSQNREFLIYLVNPPTRPEITRMRNCSQYLCHEGIYESTQAWMTA